MDGFEAEPSSKESSPPIGAPNMAMISAMAAFVLMVGDGAR
jgi:hypothetical protein